MESEITQLLLQRFLSSFRRLNSFKEFCELLLYKNSAENTFYYLVSDLELIEVNIMNLDFSLCHFDTLTCVVAHHLTNESFNYLNVADESDDNKPTSGLSVVQQCGSRVRMLSYLQRDSPERVFKV